MEAVYDEKDLNRLKEEVCEANLELAAKKLVLYTWGNVSGILREANLMVIKPSGVPYEKLTPDMMVVLDLDGRMIQGDYNPSSDTPTHLELYREFDTIGGVVHTHSTFATAWAQAKRSIACYGTTHSDYFYNEIPCTPELTSEEINGDYERNTGKVIVRTMRDRDYNAVPGILVANHGPFTWGKDPGNAVHNSVVLEELARMAQLTISINHDITGIQKVLMDKHYLRKHGKNAYYGQKVNKEQQR
ncbi:MAG: L-ribulose-5-phosphate 4-epimerase [Eubacteriales bacterium]|nr:L-ribulose-5-phosphate 4-epimerase [Eubacteriales bacterium]